jgi:hypothetical protein
MRPTEVMRLAWMELTVSCIPFTSSKLFTRVRNHSTPAFMVIMIISKGAKNGRRQI